MPRNVPPRHEPDPLELRLRRLEVSGLDAAEARILVQLERLPPQRRTLSWWIEAKFARRPLPRLATLGAAAAAGILIGLAGGPDTMHRTVDLSAIVFDVAPQAGVEP